MNEISSAGVGREMESRFINGHGPCSGGQDSVPLGDRGMPEAYADDGPLEGTRHARQTQANLRRWTG